MNSDIMVYSKSVKTDMENKGLITELAFRVGDSDYIVKRSNGVYYISSENTLFDEKIEEEFFRDVDLAMKAYSKIQNDKENQVEV